MVVEDKRRKLVYIVCCSREELHTLYVYTRSRVRSHSLREQTRRDERTRISSS